MTASERDIAAFRERTDVADVIARYVALSPARADSLKGLCPFHAETTPSFHVRPSIGHFHCFGCGFGGDVYTFVQRIEGISFGAAVAKLRRRLEVR